MSRFKPTRAEGHLKRRKSDRNLKHGDNSFAINSYDKRVSLAERLVQSLTRIASRLRSAGKGHSMAID